MAMQTPENYVFLVAHLYYLFGEPGGDTDISIDAGSEKGVR